MPYNKELQQKEIIALNAIDKLFQDTSVSKDATRESLETIKVRIEELLELLGK